MPRSDLRIGSIVIDCLDFRAMLGFWEEALRYVTKGPPSPNWAILRDPRGRSPNVSLNRVRKRMEGRNWLHFDLYTQDQAGEVKRLLEIGARRHRQTYSPEDDFVVLEDPDGNLFCVVDTTRKLVPRKDLKIWEEKGWVFKADLPDGSVVIGRGEAARVPKDGSPQQSEGGLR